MQPASSQPTLAQVLNRGLLLAYLATLRGSQTHEQIWQPRRIFLPGPAKKILTDCQPVHELEL